MPKKNGDEPTQETPAGAEIPIPTRKDVFRDLGKVAKPREAGRARPSVRILSLDRARIA